jgi:hypothetical protein
MSAIGFQNFWLSFCLENYKNKSFRLLTECENLSSSPLQEACSGFLIATCDSKSFSESRM